MPALPEDAEIRKQVGLLLERSQVPGFVLAINENGSPRIRYARGYRNVQRRWPATENTVFGIGSITKTFTAVAVLQLIERRSFTLRTPVVELLPDFRLGDPRFGLVTVEHLLSHTSGLPPTPLLGPASVRGLIGDPLQGSGLFGPDGWSEGLTPVDTFPQLLDGIAEGVPRLLGAPGQQFSYSNEGFALLGAIIEQVVHRPYEEYVSERILRPAGMRTSTFDPGIAQRCSEVTEPYALRPSNAGAEVIFAPPWWDSSVMRPTGGLRSTSSDMLRFLEIFRTGGLVGSERILTKQSVEMMLAPRSELQPGESYGLGIAVQTDWYGTRLVWHNGATKAIKADMAVVADQGWTGVALANLTEAPTRKAVLGALNVLAHRPFEDPPIRYPTLLEPVRPVVTYEGVYGTAEGFTVTARARDGKLWMQTPMGDGEARPTGPDAFLLEEGDDTHYALFFAEADGRVTGLRYLNRVFSRQGTGPRNE